MELKVIVENGIGHIEGYMTHREYADKFGLRESRVRKWIYFGKIDYIQVGSCYFIREDEPLPPEMNHMKYGELIVYLKEHSDRLDPDYYKSLKLLKEDSDIPNER